MLKALLSQENSPSSKTIISAAATITATAVICHTIVNDVLPDSIRSYGSKTLRRLSNYFSSQFVILIYETDGLVKNQMFDAADVYLSSKISPSTRRIKLSKPEKEQHWTVNVDKNQEILDSYKGIDLSWVLVSQSSPDKTGSNRKQQQISSVFASKDIRFYELGFHKKHYGAVFNSYIGYVVEQAKAIKEERKTLKLHTIDYQGTDYWGWIRLDHPATFETLAIEPETKKELIGDLEMFITRKERYRKVGKAWKRGYLLYGPPGTGKSSLVAAIANYLKFDVYDLDMKEIQCNSDLRRLLIGMRNRSILVIEDIDCSIDFQNRSSEKGFSNDENEKVTLSGMLNFIDGLWSSCANERIIIFTTNYKDRIDPALLRAGRMDMHIHMSYCSFNSFKILASNYLDTQDHPLFETIEELIKNVQATPAEVAGELMKKNDIDNSLKGLVEFLKTKSDTTHLVQQDQHPEQIIDQ